MTNAIVALELEPDNESYKSNLQIAEDKVSSGVGGGAPAGFPGMFPGMGGKISQSEISILFSHITTNDSSVYLVSTNQRVVVLISTNQISVLMTNDIAGMGGPGGMDLGAFLNNPALMNMATTMISDHNMQCTGRQHLHLLTVQQQGVRRETRVRQVPARHLGLQHDALQLQHGKTDHPIRIQYLSSNHR